MKSKRIDEIQRKYEEELFSKPDYRKQQRAEKQKKKETVTLKEWLKHNAAFVICLIVFPIGILALLDGISGGTPDSVRTGFSVFVFLVFMVGLPCLMIKLLYFLLKKEEKEKLLTGRSNLLYDLLGMSEKRNNADRQDKRNELMNEIIEQAGKNRIDHDD
ncbi:MAG: hypothetical protein MJ100_09000 [Ruminococcus sp.]|nr:hypothetical protein [Ruminococcus sp.]